MAEGKGTKGRGGWFSAPVAVDRERELPENGGGRGAASSAAAAGPAATAVPPAAPLAASGGRLEKRGRGAQRERGTSRGARW
jgi:hypothetical protein